MYVWHVALARTHSNTARPLPENGSVPFARVADAKPETTALDPQQFQPGIGVRVMQALRC